MEEIAQIFLGKPSLHDPRFAFGIARLIRKSRLYNGNGVNSSANRPYEYNRKFQKLMIRLGLSALEMPTMKQYNQTIENTEALVAFLKTPPLASAASLASSVLVQVFSADVEAKWLEDIETALRQYLPGAVIIGTSTMGEIIEGRTVVGQTVVCVSCFRNTVVTPLVFACDPGEEQAVAGRMAHDIAQIPNAKGVLMLCTVLSMDVSQLLNGLAGKIGDIPVFGGGAGNYAAMRDSVVFDGTRCLTAGAVAVVLSGQNLQIQAHAHLGWHALSRKMVVTEADGMQVKQVDGRPAFDVYRHYLNIANDENFFLNALEYPFLLERDGDILARTPMSVDESGALTFAADIAEGEEIRIGYGDPRMIASNAGGILDALDNFRPDAIFIYSCVSHRFLIQEHVDLETLPFESLGPTAGFYTSGEILGHTGRLRLLNSTIVAVSIREGDCPTDAKPDVGPKCPLPREIEARGSFIAGEQANVVSRLLHFIGAVVEELEQSNRELERLSVTDKLTQTYNRRKLDAVYMAEFQRSARHHIPFSVILLDIDHFKRVNDTFGHHAGDEVLIGLSKIILDRIRSTDVFGRWGGEEFLIILPFTTGEQAVKVAEELRAEIAAHLFPTVKRITASFGVATWAIEDIGNTLLMRADAALYQAKQGGRDRVVRK